MLQEILAYLHNTKTRPNFALLNRCNASVTLAQEYGLRAYKCEAGMSAPQKKINALRLILRPYLGQNTTIGGGIGGLLINFPALRNHYIVIGFRHSNLILLLIAYFCTVKRNKGLWRCMRPIFPCKIQ